MAGTWSQTEVAGKLVDVYEPANRSEPSRAILHLHGHGLQTLKDNSVWTAELERHGLLAFCPHGQRSWWLDRVCSEFDPAKSPQEFLLKELIPWMTAGWGVAPGSATQATTIGLTGISMGGQGIFQLAYKYPREFPIAAAISPAIDFHQWHGEGLPLDEMFESKEAARQATAILHIHPLNWPRHQMFVCDPSDELWFDGADRLAMKLSASGVPYEADLKSRAGGHDWSYFNAMAPKIVGFVADRLDQEDRRLF